MPVRKPSRTSFVQVHPDVAFRLATAVVEVKEENETYMVARELWPQLAGESAFSPKLLVTYVSKPGDVLAIWALKMPGADGRLDDWSRSALEIAATIATKDWVRITADRNLGAYSCTVAPASGVWGPPKWPALTFEDIVRVAFKDRVIQSWDHPVLRRLRGEVYNGCRNSFPDGTDGGGFVWLSDEGLECRA